MLSRSARFIGLATTATLVAAPITLTSSLLPAMAATGGTPHFNDLHANATRATTSSRTVLEIHARAGSSTSALLAQVAKTAGAFDATDVRTVTGTSTIQLQVQSADTTALTESLEHVANVADVSKAVPRYVSAVPDDTYYAEAQAPYMDAIDAPSAWDITQGSPSVTVAVIDTGVDVNHPDLVGKIAGTYNAVDGTSNVTDAIGHGTFVAGVIGASTDNALGVAGVGWNTKILAVKVADSDDNIYSSYIADGVNWAVAHGAQVINLSLGGQQTDSTEETAIANAESHGVLVVAAAGNCGGTDYANDGCTVRNPVIYPAAQPGVLSVAALTQTGSGLAPFSETGSWVSMAAPGESISSTVPTAGSELLPAGPGYIPYATGDGTSFSSPLVAGAAALVRAQYPSATMATVRSVLENSAKPIAGANVSHGELDIAAALDGLLPAGTITAPTAATELTGTVTLAGSTTAPAARFLVDGTAVGSLMVASGGSVSTTWPTIGWAEGSHTLTLVNCATTGGCGTAGASESVTVSNAVPTISTSTAAGSYVDGTITFSGTNADGGLALVVDGVVRARSATSPWTIGLATSTVTDGGHQVKMAACSADLTRCAGASSSIFTFNSYSTRPDVYHATNQYFSPNGDGVRDSAQVYLYLPDTESVGLTVVNSAGTAVYGPVGLGNMAKGDHMLTWQGTYSANYNRVPDGRYSFQLTTGKKVGTVTKRGYTAVVLVVDTKPAALTGTTVSSWYFYPRGNGSPTTFNAAVTSNEGGTLSLVVEYASHATAVTLSGARSAGRSGITWNGKLATGKLAAPGTYRWALLFVDSAGNASSTGWYPLTVH